MEVGVGMKPKIARASKPCAHCGNTYAPTNNRSLYCIACRKNRRALYGHSKWDKTPAGKAYKRAYHITLVAARKKLVYDHYGWVCNCFGERNELFLSVDHVNNNGNTDEWREEVHLRDIRKLSTRVSPQIIKYFA